VNPVIQKSACFVLKVQESGLESAIAKSCDWLGTAKAPDCFLQGYQNTFFPRKPDG